MKKVLLLVFILTGIVCSEAPAQGGKARARKAPIAVKDTDNGKTIKAAKGDAIRVTLTENPTTGYTWQITDTGGKKIKFMRDDYVADEHEPGVVGSGGKHSFYFKVLQPGTMSISLVNKRSWEKNDGGKKYNIKIKAK